jgi:hypothetical protein
LLLFHGARRVQSNLAQEKPPLAGVIATLLLTPVGYSLAR